MKKIIAYQILVLLACGLIWIQKPLGNLPDWLANYELAINCILIAAIAGSLYCLRAVYLNKCVRKSWDVDWEEEKMGTAILNLLKKTTTYTFPKINLLSYYLPLRLRGWVAVVLQTEKVITDCKF